MNTLPAIAFFLSAAALGGAGFGDIPDKKQKNPGYARSGQSHDVHELEKVSFTVLSLKTGLMNGGPGTLSYLKVTTTADSDGDGKNDEAILRVVCSKSSVKEASLWSWGASNSGSSGRAAPPVPSWEWTTPSAALTSSYLSRKLDKLHKRTSGQPGWVRVELSDGSAVCAAAGEATKSRSNIQNN
jgi:hypothetical protein